MKFAVVFNRPDATCAVGLTVTDRFHGPDHSFSPRHFADMLLIPRPQPSTCVALFGLTYDDCVRL